MPNVKTVAFPRECSVCRGYYTCQKEKCRYGSPIVRALRVAANVNFAPFSQVDWDAFAGCNTENPVIGHTGDYTVIIDGEDVHIVRYCEELEESRTETFTYKAD